MRYTKLRNSEFVETDLMADCGQEIGLACLANDRMFLFSVFNKWYAVETANYVTH